MPHQDTKICSARRLGLVWRFIGATNHTSLGKKRPTKSASEMSFRTLSEETETLAACEVPRTEMLQNKKTASVSGGPKPFVCVGRSSEKVTEWSNGPRFAMPGN